LPLFATDQFGPCCIAVTISTTWTLTSTCCLRHRLPPLLLFRGVWPLLTPLLWQLRLGLLVSPPVVLQFLPLRGSPAPIGYIYDATPDADGVLLAAALAFFSHHGHQVFHNPCPDLDKYPRAMSVSLPIIPVNCLPDHILLLGLELIETLFTPSPTNSFGTAFMAAYLESPPSPCSVPLGGLVAPLGVSGDRLVAPMGALAGSVLLPTRGIGVNMGASLFNMGGLGVPEGMPVSNMGGLGHRPDPDKKVSAPPCPQHGSLLPSLNLVHLPSYRSPTSGASSGSGIPPPLVAFGGIAGAPLSVLHPPSVGLPTRSR
jgi:hypothetical protein